MSACSRRLVGFAVALASFASVAHAGRLAGGYYHSLVVDDGGSAWGWGRNSSAQLGDSTAVDRLRPVRAASLPTITAVAAGANFTLFLGVDGKVWCAGDNSSKSCGPQGGVPSPVQAFSQAIAVAGGLYHSVALKADGTVWSWGTNAYGLGDGASTTSYTPLQVIGLTDVTAIATSWSHTLAVTGDGRVWSWGLNDYGQLGDGTQVGKTTPVQVAGLADVVAVATGRFHSLALRSDGTVWGWGVNSSGQLGDGTLMTRLTPVPVQGLGSISRIAAGMTYSLALRSDGTVWSWGSNITGQLGNGTETSRTIPGPVLLPGGVADVGAAREHALALTADGQVWAWGANDYGQVGDGTKVRRHIPVPLSDAGFAWRVATPWFAPPGGAYVANHDVTVGCETTGATIHYTTDGTEPTQASATIAAGGVLTLTQTATLKARAWRADLPSSNLAQDTYTLRPLAPLMAPPGGAYAEPQSVTLTTGTPEAEIRYTTDGSDPTAASMLYTGPVAIPHSLILKARAFKPGYSASDAAVGAYAIAEPVLVQQPRRLAGGYYHSLAVDDGGSAWGWGYNTSRQLGDGTTIERLRPVTAASLPAITAVAAGANFTLFLAVDGRVYCAGDNLCSLQGGGPPSPVQAVSEAVAVAAGLYHSVALRADGTVWTWGTNSHGLGDGVSTSSFTPVPVLTGIKAIATSWSHTLAVGSDGRVWGWGLNDWGQLGDGTQVGKTTPVQVAGLADVVAVATGRFHSLALRSDGTVWGWGVNSSGQLGDGTLVTRLTPVQIPGLTNVNRISAGTTYSLALKSDGTVWSWGSNNAGQLGNGSETNRYSPGPVSLLASVAEILATREHGLALTANGQVWAWGANDFGQVGDGTKMRRHVPVPLSEPGFVWKVATPWFNPAGGTFTADKTVTVTCVTAGATIHYTTDGTEPTQASPTIASGGVLTMTQTTTLKARAWRAGMPTSNLAEGSYVFNFGTLAAPAFDPPPGSHVAPISVAVTAAAGAKIHYTTDGTAPGTTSPVYSSPVVLTESATLRAQALKPDWNPSPVTTGTYVLRAPAPVFGPAPGTYWNDQPVTLAAALNWLAIHYTTDGVDPTEADPSVLAGASVMLDSPTTLKAVAAGPGLQTSTVTSGSYAFEAAPVTAAPAPGIYAAPVTVTLATETAGSTIRYTTDGSEPTAASGVYSNPIEVSASTVVKAKAFRDGWPSSATTMHHYVIQPWQGAIAAGEDFSIAADAAGNVWTWGQNDNGQLGDGTTTARTYVARVTGPSDVVAVAAGSDHALALTRAGLVWAWGANDAGQLGDGTTIGRTQPASVAGLSGIVAIAAGARHNLAVGADGRLFVWGANDSGQLGDGTTTASHVPRAVNGLTHVVAVSAGAAHTLALGADGRVWTWGDNTYGQLGNGSSTSSATPLEPTGLGAARAVAAGAWHSVARLADGSVWSWGDDTAWQLGRGDATPGNVPGPVWSVLCTPDGCYDSEPLGGVDTIAGGGWHTLARKSDGSVWAWGDNNRGQLLDNYVATLAAALTVPPGRLLAAGGMHSLMVTGDGQVWAWGANDAGQVGDGSADDAGEAAAQLSEPAFWWKTTPVRFGLEPGIYTVEQQLNLETAMPGAVIRYTLDGSEPGESSAVAAPAGVLLTAGAQVAARAWAAGFAASATRSAAYQFQVVDPVFDPPGGHYGAPHTVHVSTSTSDATLTYTLDESEPWALSPGVPAGGFALDGEQSITVKAWREGWLSSAAVSASYTFGVAAPAITPNGGVVAAGQVVSISTSTLGGTVRYTLDGSEPGSGAPLYTGPLRVAASATLTARAFKSGWIASSPTAATFTLEPGALEPPHLSLASGTYATARTLTVTVAAPDATIHYTVSGLEPTPSDPTITSGGTLSIDRSMVVKAKAWRGAQESAVTRGDYAVTGAVATGERHALALKSDGTVWAWGDNDWGQLGDGTNDDSTVPRQVTALSGVVAVAASDRHSLALKDDGTVWAWGDNASGQLGDGTTNSSNVPVAVVGASAIRSVAANGRWSLALRTEGTLLAWGANGGAFGDGTNSLGSLVPTPAAVGLSNIVSVTAGQGFALALATDGAVWAWGNNSAGQLGDGTYTWSLVPQRVSRLSGVTSVAAGYWASFALRTDGADRGAQWSWGLWPFGGTRPATSLTDVVRIGTGWFHSLAVRPDGRLWMWGYAPTWPANPPVLVPGIDNVVSATGGLDYSLALRSDGTVWGWGLNDDGQLGDGTSATRWTPAPVAGIRLAQNDWLDADPDNDGLSTGSEYQLGTDPLDPDTNGDGLSDGDAVALGLSPTNPDMDADGLPNRTERAIGTDPFNPDTDGDGVIDSVDAFPLDPTRWQMPEPDPGDQTPPVITLIEPANAVLVSSQP